ncbi:hypothetical protein SPAR_29861 [Streptomyces sparsogenes DSM 40356]|uniref:Uncharacterized protein n=1 Tax=Streptomyces sparsogenes DSM 40356 TaxID=1331668 RepID=A0A1R1SCT5_9ACTN|nr:hypothetical protein SPAR_29861 [Streptomyces sparsogenes DSM 40356]
MLVADAKLDRAPGIRLFTYDQADGAEVGETAALSQEQAEVLAVRGRRELEQPGRGHTGDPSVMEREADGVQTHLLHQTPRVGAERPAEFGVAVQRRVADEGLHGRTPGRVPMW